MNARQIPFIAAAAICAMTASDLASADNASSGSDGGTAFDRPSTTLLNGTLPDLPAAVEATPTDQSLGRNPLWGIPLSVLNATRDRPLFAPSRRPPGAAAVISPPVRAAKAVSPSAAPRPTLNLIGTVEGNGEGYAVFIDTATHAVVRLKTGEGQDGWILRSVREREAVLYNDDRTEVLELPSMPTTK